MLMHAYNNPEGFLYDLGKFIHKYFPNVENLFHRYSGFLYDCINLIFRFLLHETFSQNTDSTHYMKYDDDDDDDYFISGRK